ncbi:MAG: hypothetical protein VX679_05255 [Pseudomonadota bacterium]|nr:hypothetical protein [Pseudomonadota bacterium]
MDPILGLGVIIFGYVIYAFVSSNAGEVSVAGVEPEVEPEAPAPKLTGTLVSQPKAKAKAKAPAASSAPAMLRNPETGDVSAVPTNYRFAKRWIKTALVEEGLLDKVYRNNELDEEASAAVKAALGSFKELEKYQPVD